jgi:hypothetical protein
VNNPQLQTPVVLILFNRPETTARVWQAIRIARPERVFVIADGARPDRAAEIDQCQAARAVTDTIEWDGRVERNYAPIHLGIKQRIDSGLDWVFANVEQAIILEDDCVPHPTFFRYCEEMLHRYRDEERVMSISGNNFNSSYQRLSYSFSRYQLTWGWATWRRAWRLYDRTMQNWEGARTHSWLEKFLQDPRAASYWSYIFDTNAETLENWDYAWQFSCWQHGGLSISPPVNLVSNIGFRADASHTRDASSPFANFPVHAIEFPIAGPDEITRDTEQDAWIEGHQFSGTLTRLMDHLHSRIKKQRHREIE